MRQASKTPGNLGHSNFDPKRGVSVSTLAREYSRRSQVSKHAHGSDQLIYASRGIMEVLSGQSWWMIPPHFGLWIPARTPHQIRMPESVSMRTLYLRAGLADLPRACTVLHVRPLLRELIFEIVRVGELRTHSRIECAYLALLVAELEKASPVPTNMTLPRDPRAIPVARIIIEDPGTQTSLESICASTGVGVRTLQRIFRRDVGIDFESWRRQVRLMKAVELLVSGSTVKEVAFAVGYQQPNAFVALFKSTFATTPKAWTSALKRLY